MEAMNQLLSFSFFVFLTKLNAMHVLFETWLLLCVCTPVHEYSIIFGNFKLILIWPCHLTCQLHY